MRGMPSVATDSTCVSPRWNRPRAVRRRQHADLGRERPDVGRATTVDADAVVDDAAARDFLLQASGTRRFTALGFAGEAARRVGGADEARPAGRPRSRRGGRCARVLSAIAIASAVVGLGVLARTAAKTSGV